MATGSLTRDPESTEDLVKNKAADAQRHLQMIGAKSGKKQTEQRNLGYDTREADYIYIHQDDANEDWFPEDPLEAFREMRASPLISQIFDTQEAKEISIICELQKIKDEASLE
ncbi:unnamed protein product [Arabis nemorensis]|uniref:Uncharacterized protein n=1 Tax=Arabis nemorensis TaxID=586526 RepID=A0A565B444_9BRAS|nr:unnamed protein product [Arabis nemorensis]